MDESDRDALVLRFFDDRPFVEVGAKLNLTENAARMRVQRALEKVRALLARRGMTSTTAALAGMLTGQAGTAAPTAIVASISSAALAGAATPKDDTAIVATSRPPAKTLRMIICLLPFHPAGR